MNEFENLKKISLKSCNLQIINKEIKISLPNKTIESNINQVSQFKLVKIKKKTHGLLMLLFIILALIILIFNFSWILALTLSSFYVFLFLITDQLDYYLIIQTPTIKTKIKIKKSEKKNLKKFLITFYKLKDSLY